MENDAVKNIQKLLSVVEEMLQAVKLQSEMTNLLMEVQLKQYEHIANLTRCN